MPPPPPPSTRPPIGSMESNHLVLASTFGGSQKQSNKLLKFASLVHPRPWPSTRSTTINELFFWLPANDLQGDSLSPQGFPCVFFQTRGKQTKVNSQSQKSLEKEAKIEFSVKNAEKHEKVDSRSQKLREKVKMWILSIKKQWKISENGVAISNPLDHGGPGRPGRGRQRNP